MFKEPASVQHMKQNHQELPMMKVVVLEALNISYVGCYRGGEWMMGYPNTSKGRTMDCLEGSTVCVLLILIPIW